jgi:protein-tyrosine phosphatase
VKEVFWLKDGKVAGRGGPDKFPWDVDEIAQAGFSAVISMNFGKSCDVEEITEAGMKYACVPLSNNAPPAPGDKDICIKNLPGALAFIRSNLCHGPLIIHCMSGKDRTGLMMAYYLMLECNFSPEDAMSEVIKVRDIAFSANGWKEFCLDILDSFMK